MSEKRTSTGLSRRRFLQLAGAAAGTFAIPSALLELEPDSKRHGARGLRIGVLLPESRLYPGMSQSYFEGMKLGFDKCIPKSGYPSLVKEDISHAVTRERFRAVPEEQRIDLITGLFNSRVASGLSNMTDNDTHYFASSVGEKMLQAGEAGASFVHSLGYWQSNWAMGRWAAEHIGKRAFVASSFYESGFDGVYAFRLGYESMGGSILGTAISHMPGSSELPDILKEAGRTSPDFVYALYCGREAEEFIAAYSSSGLQNRIPLAGSPFMTDEAVLERAGRAAIGIKTCLPWAVSLDTAANTEFVESFARKNGRRPDPFALLGYETAGLIASAAASRSGLAQGLRQARFSGPRGEVAPGGIVPGSMFLREVGFSGGRPVNKILSRVEAGCTGPGEMTATRSGWTNPYMCT